MGFYVDYVIIIFFLYEERIIKQTLDKIIFSFINAIKLDRLISCVVSVLSKYNLISSISGVLKFEQTQ